MPIQVAIYEGEEQVEYTELPGDVDDYDIVIHSTPSVEFPAKEKEGPAPPLTEIDLEEIEVANNRTNYKRMQQNPESQPAEIRQFIFEQQLLTRQVLDKWARDRDYSAHGGGIQTTLVVLDNITDEIERIGEGEDQRIIWTKDD